MAFTGLTKKTPENLLLDAGAFLKDYDAAKDTWDTAKATKLLGATSGGGSFSAAPTIRQVSVDGAKGAVKGLEVLDEWVVTLTATVKEITANNIKLSLAAAKSETTTAPEGYQKITGKSEIEEADYLENLTWVGRLSGSDKPVIIQIFNGLATNGLTVSFSDKNEGTIPITVTGHYSMDDLDTPPFAIYYPEGK